MLTEAAQTKILRSAWGTSLFLAAALFAVFIAALLTRNKGASAFNTSIANYHLAGTIIFLSIATFAVVHADKPFSQRKWIWAMAIGLVVWLIGAALDIGVQHNQANFYENMRIAPDFPALLSLTILTSSMCISYREADRGKIYLKIFCCGTYSSLYLQLSYPAPNSLSLFAVHFFLILAVTLVWGSIAIHPVGKHQRSR